MQANSLSWMLRVLTGKPAHNTPFYLPDFCSLHAVFAVVILAEIFALVLSLAQSTDVASFWLELGMTSLFMQWAGLSGAAVLCLARRWLGSLSVLAATLLSQGLLLLVILLLSELAWRLVILPVQGGAADSHGLFLMRNLLIGGIICAAGLRYFHLAAQSRQQLIAASEFRLAALRARIRPHFLFNSFNSIASLTGSNPQQAEGAIEDLAALFRASLLDERRLIPLAEELELTRHYLHIETLRLGERLQVDWQVDELPLDALLPPLCLQPLVENAVYHGIEQLAGGGCIQIHGDCSAGQVHMTVRNPFPGNGEAHKGNQLALENIRQRLAFHFGSRGRMAIQQDGQHYEVTLHLPLQKEPA